MQPPLMQGRKSSVIVASAALLLLAALIFRFGAAPTEQRDKPRFQLSQRAHDALDGMAELDLLRASGGVDEGSYLRRRAELKATVRDELERRR